MTLAIDKETESIARRLATLRGETVEQAVGVAVRAELARAQRKESAVLTAEQREKIERTLAMVRALPRLNADGGDPTAFLYGDDGPAR